MTDAELRAAVAGVFRHRAVLGPARISRLLRAGRDRLGLDWGQLSELSGYPLPTAFRLTGSA